MAQIPTSSITMAAIATELGISTSSITLDNCRANSNAFTMSSTSVPGHTRDGNEQTNTNASPWNNTMAEWAGYTHTQSMGSITYGVRISTASATWGLKQASTHIEIENSAYAEGAITIWRIHDGSNTYIKAKSYNEPTSQATRQYHNGSSAQTLTNNTTGQTLITIPVSDVTITATVTGLSGTTISYTPTTPDGSTTADDISGTGAALLVCRGAESAEADVGYADLQAGRFKVTFTASKSGYQTTNLDNGVSNGGIIVHSTNDAAAEGGE